MTSQNKMDDVLWELLYVSCMCAYISYLYFNHMKIVDDYTNSEVSIFTIPLGTCKEAEAYGATISSLNQMDQR